MGFFSGGMVLFIVLSIPILIQVQLYYYFQLAADYLTPVSVQDNEEFDFIIVGAGSAGSTVTGRLAEDGYKVLLVEAGGEPHYFMQIPSCAAAFFAPCQDDHYCWPHFNAPQKHCCKGYPNRQPKATSGKGLGGGSQLNFMNYVRGNGRDYDEWESLGNPGWSYKDVLPYFKKAERYHNPFNSSEPIDMDFHGTSGRLSVMTTGDMPPFSHLIGKAGEEMGFVTGDHHGGKQNEQVVFRSHTNQKSGFRADTFSSFISDPGLLEKGNLKVITNAHVTRLLISDESDVQVKGVEISRFGRTSQYFSTKEVILSAGAAGSPKIMLLSGLGPKQHLQDLGLKVFKDIPGVGENLQDHVTSFYNVFSKNKDLFPSLWQALNPFEALRYYFTGHGGPFGDSGIGYGVFFDSGQTKDDKFNRRDMQLHNLPISWNFDYGLGAHQLMGLKKEYIEALFKGHEHDPAGMLFPTLLRPKSRGTVKLRSINPFDPPLINSNFLNHPNDIKVLVAAMHVANRFTKTKAFKDNGIAHLPDPFCKKHKLHSDEYYECIISYNAAGMWHTSGTCAMGPKLDPMAVVDSSLKVHGIKGLRVVDTSIMPRIVGGNPNAPVIMIAEKAADMIKDDWPMQKQSSEEIPAKQEL